MKGFRVNIFLTILSTRKVIILTNVEWQILVKIIVFDLDFVFIDVSYNIEKY